MSTISKNGHWKVIFILWFIKGIKLQNMYEYGRNYSISHWSFPCEYRWVNHVLHKKSWTSIALPWIQSALTVALSKECHWKINFSSKISSSYKHVWEHWWSSLGYHRNWETLISSQCLYFTYRQALVR